MIIGQRAGLILACALNAAASVTLDGAVVAGDISASLLKHKCSFSSRLTLRKARSSLPREAPRLCRGCSRSLTFKESSIDETLNSLATTRTSAILRWTTPEPSETTRRAQSNVSQVRAGMSIRNNLKPSSPLSGVLRGRDYQSRFERVTPKAPGFAA